MMRLNMGEAVFADITNRRRSNDLVWLRTETFSDSDKSIACGLKVADDARKDLFTGK
jgi:hypothetical protein